MIDKKLWDDILSYLISKEIISDQAFNLWLKDVDITFNDRVVSLTFPNSLSKEKFETSFSDIIKKTFLDFNRFDIDFVYKVGKEKPIEPKKEGKESTTTTPKKAAQQKNDLSEIYTFNQIKYLNPRYTFENFVIGKNNQFCAAAAQRVAKAPGQAFNPLFIYGGVGLGKTHILQAIAHNLLNTSPTLKILYMQTEQFVDEFIYAIKNDQVPNFRLKFRNADVLLIDDIQFLERKDASMEEFFHTFNALHQSQKQMVFTCDKPPKDLRELEERVRNRMEWGIQVLIQPPDYETRIAILRKKGEIENQNIPEQVYSFIAKNIKTSIRELESALIKIIAYCDFSNIDISTFSVDDAKEVLKDQLKSFDETRIVQIDDIIRKVAEKFKVSTVDLKSKKKNKSISLARNVAMYLARELTPTSTTEIGLSFGGKDHSTIIHACNKINDLIIEDELLKTTINNLRKEIVS